MAVKAKNNLFLYLTLACFLGIILIFIFDGYIGTYDSLKITSGERESTIDTDVWLRGDPYYATGIDWGEQAFFSYKVDNRRFSAYTADVQVSLWHSQEMVAEIANQPLSLASFEEGQVAWTLDTAELVPADVPPEQGYEFTLLIKRGDIERSVVVHVRAGPIPTKTVIIEPPSD